MEVLWQGVSEGRGGGGGGGREQEGNPIIWRDPTLTVVKLATIIMVALQLQPA
jgi:hypothetical protein